ncbi:uncharacterized protein BYT42DRAFT_560049 [Radiomyces spectabilis]|uniref:uncharacterized protein n=1 Tax=Radiomyces spectabilis TaxID=64574 RepID=UPI00222104A0|nr:uncharacterized protein BYT42DRAFT_560049 [Radiomyces spectabilis]KAI8388424.1 hypothetical protein BYT42DRAFT_560049 [Radiomyces spectabilis]
MLATLSSIDPAAVLPPLTRSKHGKWMEALPSFRSVCGDVDAASAIVSAPSGVRHHARTVSLPARLPSQHASRHHRLSMDVLLDAIDLDRHMNQFYTHERAKCALRRVTHHHPFKTSPVVIRRRSKSAPGALESRHNLSTRWFIPMTGSHLNATPKEIAKSIVQQHIEYATRK